MRLICALLLVPVLVLGGCSSGGGTSIDAALQEVADCTGLGIEELSGIVDGFFAMLEVIDSGQPSGTAGITYDLVAGTFSFPVDLDGDGNSDGTVSGTLATQDDLSDGIDVNETLSALWDLTAGAVSGSGQFGFARTIDAFQFTGTGSVGAGPNCSFAVTGSDLLFGTNVGGSVGGTIDFVTSSPGGDLTGTMTFTPSSDIADVSATFLGVTVNFDIDLNTFTVIF